MGLQVDLIFEVNKGNVINYIVIVIAMQDIVVQLARFPIMHT